MFDVVFDIGGVLIDWNPRFLYEKIIADEQERALFLAQVCSPQWNANQDLGRSWKVAETEAVDRFPEWNDAIAAYRGRWGEMVQGPIPGGFELLRDVFAKNHRVSGLSNWNHETFAEMRVRFPMLNLMQCITVSGEVGLANPDPAIYEMHATRLATRAESIVFVDDNAVNIEAARQHGWKTVLFRDADSARSELEALGVL